jgi:hypothetical protein
MGYCGRHKNNVLALLVHGSALGLPHLYTPTTNCFSKLFISTKKNVHYGCKAWKDLDFSRVI